ncbi:insulin-like growth factor-binding protein complex acid labile subunit [Galendromus occidentalis]|uniref:Insulin-like growth factor-binding protein complex acid labile subunit n=1 Tax=Galendromus occidentalis TaxID=34638 RepID=A0AAJ7SIF7_9ACAR|nr:insulin-like growth factor-binding protein complex acid labile subunit [Galendromus occidentalis]
MVTLGVKRVREESALWRELSSIQKVIRLNLNSRMRLVDFVEKYRFGRPPHSLQFFVWNAILVSAVSYGARMCPSRCECRDDELAVVCLNAQLDMVPWTLHPRLRSLNLRGNNIKQVSRSFSFSDYSSLRVLDLSQNQLVDLHQRSFASLLALEILDLSKNMIAGLSNGTLDGLSHLEQLLLAYNYIDEIPAGTFRELTVLQRLDLSHNRIKTLRDPDTFRGCGKKLRVLSLRNNQLTSVPTNVFGPLAELAALDLGRNDIKLVSSEAFLPLRTLEELRLDGCKLTTIQPGALRALGGLRVLRLEDNDLKDTPSTSFSDIPRLEEIHLGQNPLSNLKERAFQHLRHLRTLSVESATELRSVDSNALIDNQQLESIVLSRNVRLKSLDSATFRPLSRLRSVNLRGNGLSHIPVDLLSAVSWDDLIELDLRDNPLVCNCSLRWLLNKRRQQQQATPVKVAGVTAVAFSTASFNSSLSSPFANETTRIKCAGPSHLAGLYLDELPHEDSLECNGLPRTLRFALLISAVALLSIFSLSVSVYCCLKHRHRIPCGRKKLSPKSPQSDHKQVATPEWMGAQQLEKSSHEYLYGQTRLPISTQSREQLSDMQDGAGVYICQLSTGQRRPPVRLVQQGPDLLDLCRPDTRGDGFTSVPRQPGRVTLNNSRTSLQQQQQQQQQSRSHARPPQPEHRDVNPPFCYYFE